jgi:WD40 repeat protein
VVTASGDHLIYLWDTFSLRKIGLLKGHYDDICSVEYTQDGIVSSAKDGSVRIWDAETYKEISQFRGGGRDDFGAATISSDGKYIAVEKGMGGIIVFDTQTLQELGYWDGLPTCNLSTCNPELTLMVKSNRNSVIIWDIQNKEAVVKLEGHSDWVKTVIYSNDGKYILSGSADGTAKLWSVESRECIYTFRNVPGLEVLGCDFRNLHPDSKLSDEDKQLLWEYGAEV